MLSIHDETHPKIQLLSIHRPLYVKHSHASHVSIFHERTYSEMDGGIRLLGI